MYLVEIGYGDYYEQPIKTVMGFTSNLEVANRKAEALRYAYERHTSAVEAYLELLDKRLELLDMQAAEDAREVVDNYEDEAIALLEAEGHIEPEYISEYSGDFYTVRVLEVAELEGL